MRGLIACPLFNPQLTLKYPHKESDCWLNCWGKQGVVGGEGDEEKKEKDAGERKAAERERERES